MASFLCVCMRDTWFATVTPRIAGCSTLPARCTIAWTACRLKTSAVKSQNSSVASSTRYAIVGSPAALAVVTNNCAPV